MDLLAAVQQTGSTGWIIAIVVSILSGLVGGLVLFNLNGIKSYIEKISDRVDKQDSRLEKQDDRVKAVEQSMSDCKIDCERNTVSKEDWVRSEGYTRKELKDVTAVLNRLEGKLDVTNKLPEIAAEIAARTAKQVIQEVRNHE